jgi:hypothetical protein
VKCKSPSILRRFHEAASAYNHHTHATPAIAELNTEEQGEALPHCRAAFCASQSVLGRGEHLHWREAEFRQQILDWADEPKVASTKQRIPTITVVVYKVDRLTRSPADFAKLVEMGDSARRARLCVKRRFSDNEPCSFASSDAAALIVSGGSLRGDRSRSLRQLPISRDGRQSARLCRQSRRL